MTGAWKLNAPTTPGWYWAIRDIDYYPELVHLRMAPTPSGPYYYVSVTGEEEDMQPSEIDYWWHERIEMPPLPRHPLEI